MKIRPSLSRYDVDEGFEEHQTQSEPVFEIDKTQSPGFLFPVSKNQTKSRSLSKKQQAKLSTTFRNQGFISIQRQKSQSSHYQYLKKQHEKNIHKSLTLSKEEQSFFSSKKKNKMPKPPNKLPPMQSFNNSLIKLKRSQIGENLEFIQHNAHEIKALKESLINNGASIIFQEKCQTNSHGMFKKYLNMKSYNFLKSKYNSPLLHKINASFVNPKHQISDKLSQYNSARKQLEFISDFESSNLDFVTQINPFEYDLYIKADTNTMGHQNWFYFKLLNHTQEKKTIFMNVCNLKRSFKMIKKGQKFFYRFRKIIKSSLKTSIETEEQQWTEWTKLDQQVTVSPNFITTNNTKRKVYKLSFSSTLLAQMEYQFSLLPPFTYSEMLQKVQELQKSCNNLTVQVLTYSHLGLCIPLLTFTSKLSQNQNKKVILISSRIHPGETCASFVIKGIIQKLSQESQQTSKLLENYIIKIVPIINPDGVILGNFRTNYLGSDLNRSFHEEDEVTFPEVVALKLLGKKLKDEHKENFLCFLDFHGHSSQKNIFSYGPNYDERHKKFLHSRFLPKALSVLTDQFDYNKCTFVLQECKSNTARGFFLKKLNVMAFTIQASYALYDNNKQEELKNQDLKSDKLMTFGHNVVKALNIWNNQSLNPQKISKIDIDNVQNEKENASFQENQSLMIKKIKTELIKQSKLTNRRRARRKEAQPKQGQSSQEDSDGESQSQDIPIKERQKLYRRFIQSNNSSVFPRILRPAIIHPQVNPPAPLFSVSKINPSQSVKGSIANVRMKRSRYTTNIKPINANNAYTEYLLREVKGLQSLKPSVNLMKLSHKQTSLIKSTNLEIK